MQRGVIKELTWKGSILIEANPPQRVNADGSISLVYPDPPPRISKNAKVRRANGGKKRSLNNSWQMRRQNSSIPSSEATDPSSFHSRPLSSASTDLEPAAPKSRVAPLGILVPTPATSSGSAPAIQAETGKPSTGVVSSGHPVPTPGTSLSPMKSSPGLEPVSAITAEIRRSSSITVSNSPTSRPSTSSPSSKETPIQPSANQLAPSFTFKSIPPLNSGPGTPVVTQKSSSTAVSSGHPSSTTDISSSPPKETPTVDPLTSHPQSSPTPKSSAPLKPEPVQSTQKSSTTTGHSTPSSKAVVTATTSSPTVTPSTTVSWVSALLVSQM